MENHWRNAMKSVRFFGIDARAAFPLGLFIVHARLWTFLLTILGMLLFWALERRGLDFSSALRAARRWFVGKSRPALLWYKKRKMIDTGSI